MTEDSEPLLEEHADRDPFVQFARWFDEAGTVVAHPESMAVATATAIGYPSVRMVLLKAWDVNGFTFYTNYESRKGRELSDNPRASLLWHWEPLGRQIRVEGQVHRIPDDQSDTYFATRSVGAQIGAYASHQSQSIGSRAALEAQVERLGAEHAGRAVARPAWWGGLRVRPESFEFWQNRQDRLHDRLLYSRDGHGWRIERLQP